MSKHTKGPWEVCPSPGRQLTAEQADIEQAKDGKRFKVATVYWKRDHDLFAAAPKLLAACKAAVEAAKKEFLYQTGQLPDNPPTPRSVHSDLHDALCVCKAAIDKADGR